MSNKNVYDVDEETIEILKEGNIKDNVYYLPNKQLDRSVYDKVNKVLVALGAKWNRKLKGHTFEYDISKELEYVFIEKKVTDWKKETDYFFTPAEVVEIMISMIPIHYAGKYEFLEPSCGQGHIADVIRDKFNNSNITCIEKNRRHCDYMRNKGYNPICTDFLEVTPEEKYDVILMNPPFKSEWEHIKHSYKFLKDEGFLVSVASANVLENETKKGKEFKKWFNQRCGYCFKLPPGSFKESGTNVNTVLLIFEKEEEI